MKTKILFVVLLTIAITSDATFAKIIDQRNSGKKKVSFRIYEVRKGETLSEIAWVLGVKMNELVNWNEKIMNNGIRRIVAGMKIKYRLPGDIEKIVASNIKNINRTIEKKNGAIIKRIEELKRENLIRNDENDKALSSFSGKIDSLSGGVDSLLRKMKKNHDAVVREINSINKNQEKIISITSSAGNIEKNKDNFSKINKIDRTLNIVFFSVMVIIALLLILVLGFLFKEKMKRAKAS